MKTGATAILCLLALGCGRVGYDATAQQDGDASVTTDAPAGSDGSVGAGCGAMAIFCDGFESATLVPPWGGTIVEPGTTLGRSDAFVTSGTGALEASVPTERTAAFVYAPLDPGVSGGTVFARGWFRFSADVLQHLDFLTLASGDGDIGTFVIGGEMGVFNPFSVGEIRSAPVYVVPADRFICVELHLDLDSTAGVIDVWVDGVLVLHAEGMRTLGTSPVSQVRVGANFAGFGQSAATVWVDDVVVSTERIGCL